MISLVLTIIFTVFLFLCFKEFSYRKVNTNQAITFNYLTASFLAYLFYSEPISGLNIIQSDWIKPTVLLGVFFVIMFNIMAITTKKLGISIASMASKMSLIIPVIGAVIIEDNIDISLINAFGIILALVAVYFTFKKEEGLNEPIYIAIILFFGAGILDMSLNFIQSTYLKTENDFSQFIIVIFLVAFLSGLIKIIISKQKIKIKNIIAGITLGIPNYFSIFFVLDSLEKIGPIIVFPVLNIGVVLLSSILSSLFYHEYLNKLNWAGIALACISILLILVF